MIYMDPLQLGWEALLQSWLLTSLPNCLVGQQREIIKVWIVFLCNIFLFQPIRIYSIIAAISLVL